jgi:hypothetical protein
MCRALRSIIFQQPPFPPFKGERAMGAAAGMVEMRRRAPMKPDPRGNPIMRRSIAGELLARLLLFWRSGV